MITHQVDKNSDWDAVIIGGGAAGFFGAISIMEHSSAPKKVLLVEKTNKLLGKVKVSGGGRCNVTHNCLEPRPLIQHYPRGGKTLLGPFNHFGPQETIEWFESRGVTLKTEPDGRMFPITDDSQTIIDCLIREASDLGVQIALKSGISDVEFNGETYTLEINGEFSISSKSILVATGGTRLTAGPKLLTKLDHTLLPPVPSLFTFAISHNLLSDLEGLSVSHAKVEIVGKRHVTEGPVLITHWGLSGPGILKLSAVGARELADCSYSFQIKVNWCPKISPENTLIQMRKDYGKRQITKRSPFNAIPKRLWSNFCSEANITPTQTWSQLTKTQQQTLLSYLTSSIFDVEGKSINKDEFVTCGGVQLKDVVTQTMESKLSKNLYFAGEVLNIDGVTGGFNFQNAWTTGFIAGRSISQRLSSHSTL